MPCNVCQRRDVLHWSLLAPTCACASYSTKAHRARDVDVQWIACPSTKCHPLVEDGWEVERLESTLVRRWSSETTHRRPVRSVALLACMQTIRCFSQPGISYAMTGDPRPRASNHLRLSPSWSSSLSSGSDVERWGRVGGAETHE